MQENWVIYCSSYGRYVHLLKAGRGRTIQPGGTKYAYNIYLIFKQHGLKAIRSESICNKYETKATTFLIPKVPKFEHLTLS